MGMATSMLASTDWFHWKLSTTQIRSRPEPREPASRDRAAAQHDEDHEDGEYRDGIGAEQRSVSVRLGLGDTDDEASRDGEGKGHQPAGQGGRQQRKEQAGE